MKKKREEIWTRFGDGDGYRSHGDDLDALADCIHEHRIESAGINWIDGGFVAPGYEGCNYVSLYWGDAAGDMVRRLTKPERREVVRLLEKR